MTSLNESPTKDRNSRSDSNHMQLIPDTQHASAAGGYVICLQLWYKLKHLLADR